MPHSTQTRTRCVGTGVFDEKRRFRNDIPGLQGTLTRRSRTERGATGLHRPANPPTRPPSLDSRIGQRVRMARTTTPALWIHGPYPFHNRIGDLLADRFRVVNVAAEVTVRLP